MINDFIKITGWKLKIQKSILFLHTSNKKLESKKILNDNTYNSIKVIKYLEINLIKAVQGSLHRNLQNTIEREKNKEDQNKWSALL